MVPLYTDRKTGQLLQKYLFRHPLLEFIFLLCVVVARLEPDAVVAEEVDEVVVRLRRVLIVAA